LLVIRDLATTNGTKVKGQRIRWAALLPEDKVSLGGYKVRIYLGSDEMPSPSEQRRARSGAGAVPSPSVDPHRRAAGFPHPSPDPDAVSPESAAASSERMAKKPALVTAHQDRAPEPPLPLSIESGFEIVEEDEDEIIDLE
jgi:hypothetical protein